MAKQILIIEDDADIRQLAVLMLQPAGYDVLEAGCGEDGLRLLAEHTVDLLIQDIMLPGINGWEVCRQLRADPKTATLPILLFTVRNSWQRDKNNTTQEMVNGFVNKPFQRDDLLTAVRQLIGLSNP